MRAVLQRVTSAAVAIDGEVVGSIGAGCVLLVGVTHSDDLSTARMLARKVHGLRVFDGPNGAVSLADTGGAVLLVSQFTLYADTSKGRRPSWSAAAPGPIAEPLVDAVRDELVALSLEVSTGRFGADMQVSLVNDGPVTIVLDVP